MQDLLERALALPPEARAELAGLLLASLDASVDSGAESAWAVEVERRTGEIDEGVVKLEPWKSARNQISG